MFAALELEDTTSCNPHTLSRRLCIEILIVSGLSMYANLIATKIALRGCSMMLSEYTVY